jgi:RimJ/RimL family protein N-acetyltransferase
MLADQPVLTGTHVRLEPLALRHLDGLLAAANADPSLYDMTVVPQTAEAMTIYINTALDWRAKGIALPFATIRAQDGLILGSTRFYDIENWPWPEGHPQHGRTTPDVCEIGYTWLTRSAIRTGANTEAKLLMLTHAFESWNVHRVCLHTDARNTRSREAIGRLGARFEGILRAHKMASDFTIRDSARFSILAAEWPEAKQRLRTFLDARNA